MEVNLENISRQFTALFGSDPILIESPARVNLIGEHTDYNDGFVLPAAIDRKIGLAMAHNNVNEIRLFAADMDSGAFTSVYSENIVSSGLGWPDYILGIIDQLQKRNIGTGGFDCLFGGDIPIGAGLSSSAALEGGVLTGLNHLFDLDLTILEMAKIGQAAENEFVGVQCGIMDQFANLYGKDGNVIKLDCRSLEFSYHPFDQHDIEILLFDTGVRRELTTSEYNVRRKQCEQGVDVLRKYDPEIVNLRDVTKSLLETHREKLSNTIYNRCRFVLEENQRVLDASSDLTAGDILSFGQRMYQSHYGLRDLYEVSCPELDHLVETTESMDAVLGARMMGGGFGGCTVNLVQSVDAEQVIERVNKSYEDVFGNNPGCYRAKICRGSTIVDRALSTIKKAENGSLE